MTTTLPMTRDELVDLLAGQWLEQRCRTCRGEGSLIVDDPRNAYTCPTCRGSGAKETHREPRR